MSDEGVIKYLEKPAVGTKKLSALIREGAKLRPQCKNRYFDHGASCAIGAAYESLTGISDQGSHCIVDKLQTEVNIPNGIIDMITLMNDSGSTREQCADYAESKGY